MYRVKYKEDDWSRYTSKSKDDETFWTEENDARREFDSIKDHIRNNHQYSEVELHELQVDSSDSKHKLLDSYNNYEKIDISDGFNFGHG